MICIKTIASLFIFGLTSCVIAQDILRGFDTGRNILKEHCDKNGGATAFQAVKKARNDCETCIKSLVNVTELRSEMEVAIPTGELDEVFSNYCRKSPHLKKCLTDFIAALEPCLDETERAKTRIVKNITESLLNFICYAEGDRIALFIAASGPQCFQNKQQAVQDCANATFGSYIPASRPSTGTVPAPMSHPSFGFDTKGCKDISTFQTCVVEALEGCEDPTPANIVDSLFNFIKKSTPCGNLPVA